MKKEKVTAKSALCHHLLNGDVLNIKNCFTLIGLTNCPREISRMIEQPFGVTVTRIRKEGTSRYGQPVTWVDYCLDTQLENNKEGVEKMKEYCGYEFKSTPRVYLEWVMDDPNDLPTTYRVLPKCGHSSTKL